MPCLFIWDSSILLHRIVNVSKIKLFKFSIQFFKYPIIKIWILQPSSSKIFNSTIIQFINSSTFYFFNSSIPHIFNSSTLQFFKSLYLEVFISKIYNSSNLKISIFLFSHLQLLHYQFVLITNLQTHKNKNY